MISQPEYGEHVLGYFILPAHAAELLFRVFGNEQETTRIVGQPGSNSVTASAEDWYPKTRASLSNSQVLACQEGPYILRAPTP